MNSKLTLALFLSVILTAGVLFLKKESVSDAPFLQNHETEEELSKKTRVLARAEQEFNMTKDPELGVIPKERLWKAQEYVRSLQREIENSGKARGAVSGVSWTSRGPDNVGGRTRAVMFDPTDSASKRVIAGSVSGGLWKNADITNSTSSWVKVNDFLDNLAITVLVADPNNTNTWYAATGEAYTAVTPGNGIYKSTNAGTTWTHLSSTSSYPFITSLVVRNESGTSTLYMGTKRKSNGSETGGDLNGVQGLFRSTDGGVNWSSSVLPSPNDDQTPDHIMLDANNDLWVAVGRNSFGEKGGDILKCTTGCGTATNWTLKYDASANGFNSADRTILAIAPSDANRIYAIAGKDGAGNTDIEFFIKSTDGGTNWSTLTIPKNYDIGSCTAHATDHFTRAQATYDLTIAVHPTNPDIALLGGIDMYRTTDGFANSSHISSWYTGSAPCDKEMHADQHTIVWRPGNSNEVIFGNDGGVYYSADAGNSSVSAPSFAHHVKDYNVTQFYSCDIDPTSNTNRYLAGAQDNGTQFFNNSTTTSEAVGGDGGWGHIDQNENNIQLGAYIHNDFTHTNNSWSSKTQITPTTQTGRFINPSAYDYVGNILYSGSNANQICRTTGIGATAVLTDGINVTGSGLGGSKATTMRVSRNTVTTLYVGTDAGKVYKITNANTGASVSSTDISTGLPSGWVSSIDVQKGNENHLLVTLSNYGINSVWESTNGGTSWTSVEGNLPDIPIRWGVFSPVNNDNAFLATELGVWSTDNLNGGSTNWGVTVSGLANVRTDMIKYRHDDGTTRSAAASATLAIATHGRGLFTASLSNPLPVELTHFNAIADKNEIVLKWATAFEENNQGFEIQRSLSPANGFDAIGWIDGKGDAFEISRYEFLDYDVIKGESYYYRLKQIDQDGQYSFSPIREASIRDNHQINFSIAPNPARDFTTIYFSEPLAKYDLSIFDQSGKRIRFVEVNDGNIDYQLATQDLSTGLYLVHVKSKEMVYIDRFMVLD